MSVFTPLADDRHANTLELFEVGMQKSSGYIQVYGVVPAEHRTPALLALSADAQARGGRLVLSRKVGEAEWHIIPQTDDADTATVDIPDTLPEDFA